MNRLEFIIENGDLKQRVEKQREEFEKFVKGFSGRVCTEEIKKAALALTEYRGSEYNIRVTVDTITKDYIIEVMTVEDNSKIMTFHIAKELYPMFECEFGRLEQERIEEVRLR